MPPPHTHTPQSVPCFSLFYILSFWGNFLKTGFKPAGGLKYPGLEDPQVSPTWPLQCLTLSQAGGGHGRGAAPFGAGCLRSIHPALAVPWGSWLYHRERRTRWGWGAGAGLWLHLPQEESREQCGSQGRCTCRARSGCGGVPPEMLRDPWHGNQLMLSPCASSSFPPCAVADHRQHWASPKSPGWRPGTSHRTGIGESKGPSPLSGPTFPTCLRTPRPKEGNLHSELAGHPTPQGIRLWQNFC